MRRCVEAVALVDVDLSDFTTDELVAELRERASDGDPHAQQVMREAPEAREWRRTPADVARDFRAAQAGRHPFLTVGRV